MAETIKIEIVTPTGLAVSRDVLEIDAPTLGGEIGILPGHVPLLAALRTGLVTIKPVGASGDEPLRFAIAHGVLEVALDKAVILTEKFAKKDDVDTVKVRARLKEVDEELTAWEGEVDDQKRIDLIEEEQWLAAELELIGDPPAPTMREITRFKVKEVDVIQEGEDAEAPEPPAKPE